MIVLQSLAIVRSSSYRPCHSPSPGGSNERSECRLVCCSGVGRDEGELCSRGRQSALTQACVALRPRLSGTFENSQQHARVIYGWVQRPKPIKVPKGTAEIFLHVARIKNMAAAHARSSFCLNLYDSVAKSQICQTNPFRKIRKSLQINQKRKNLESFWRKNEPIFPGFGWAARQKNIEIAKRTQFAGQISINQ